MIHINTRIIPVTLPIAAAIPLCTETITAKGRITMIMAIVMKTPILHILTIMINTMSGHAGAVIIKPSGISVTGIMITLRMITTALNTETVALIMMATTGTTTVSTAGAIMTDLAVNKRPLWFRFLFLL